MSRQQKIAIGHDFDVPVTRLFSHLAEHENLARLFAPAKVERLKDGDTDRNGVGSQRLIGPGPLPSFIETVTRYQQNELIEYRITKGGMLRNHRGCIRFTSLGGGRSRVEFEIVFEGRLPGAGPLFSHILNRSIRNGLVDLALNPGLLEAAGTPR